MKTGRIVKSLLVGAAVASMLLAFAGGPSASAQGGQMPPLKVDETCSPHIFRPNEWVLHECLIHVTNVGDTPLSNFETVWSFSSGVDPDWYFVLYEVDGIPRPIDPTALRFGIAGTLQPGQSSDTRLNVLLRMPTEGVYDGGWNIEADGQVVAAAPPVHYEARADAADPPTGVAISQAGEQKGASAVFHTTITNNSPSAITQLTVSEHYGSYLTPAETQFEPSQPTPNAGLLQWDLAALGVQSLASGESLTFSTTYTSDDPSVLARLGTMVEATVDGEDQLFGSSDEASLQPPDLKIDETCSPNVFRPNEWTLHECLIDLTNTGDTPLSNLSGDYVSGSGVIPDHYFILYEVDGQPRPIDPTGLSFGNSDTLQPGQTFDVRLDVLLRMPSVGVYDGEWPVEVDGVIVPGTPPNHYEARADAADPLTGLKVEQVNHELDASSVLFDTTITNNSSSAITQLAITEHYGPDQELKETQFTPSESDPDEGLLEWDLASLGVQSLAPGESLKFSTTYSTSGGAVESGVMVEATVDGKQQLYGVSSQNSCDGCGIGAVGDVPSVGPAAALPPNTGEGPSDARIPTLWEILAGAGLALSGVALVARRRVRR